MAFAQSTPFGQCTASSAASRLSLVPLQEHQLCYRSGWAAAPAWQPGGPYEPGNAHPWEHARRPEGYTGRVSAPAAPPAVGWGGQCIESGAQCQQAAAGFGRGSAGAFHRRASPAARPASQPHASWRVIRFTLLIECLALVVVGCSGARERARLGQPAGARFLKPSLRLRLRSDEGHLLCRQRLTLPTGCMFCRYGGRARGSCGNARGGGGGGPREGLSVDEIVWRVKQLPPNEPVGALAESTLAGLDSRGCAHLFKKCAEAQMARRAQARRPQYLTRLLLPPTMGACIHVWDEDMERNCSVHVLSCGRGVVAACDKADTVGVTLCCEAHDNDTVDRLAPRWRRSCLTGWWGWRLGTPPRRCATCTPSRRLLRFARPRTRRAPALLTMHVGHGLAADGAQLSLRACL